MFLGINSKEAYKLDKYNIVVIEPSEFSNEQIDKLHKEGKTVYGYLNIGAIEKYRPYYKQFQHLTLGVYKDWPDEKWIDTSSYIWQDFIINELGKQYSNMKLDGLFLDNTDIYYNFQTEDIFQGLCNILKGLKKYNFKLIINGGDLFVSKTIDKDIALSLFDGINQETVFTSINFSNKTYATQSEKETTYFKNYLSKVKENGLSVYLLEYKADKILSKKIDDYCLKNGFSWYNAKGLKLD